jgi:glycosyltransferase involved in cell wall biosynthesis
LLSVVIPTHNSEAALLPTLSALVPGAAAGVVREVILADAASTDATLEIADAAGCRVLAQPGQPVGARLKAGADAARATWLMFLRPGTVPDPGWTAEASRFLEQSELQARGDAAATFRLGGGDIMRPAVMEALVLLRAALAGRARPEQGLLIPKRFYDELGGHAPHHDAERDLLRRIGRRRMVTLRCGAVSPV